MAPREPIKVLVVDDSAFARVVITRLLDAEPDIEVIGFAANGEEALPLVDRLAPDVITLDVEMPKINGIETLKLIMEQHPTPVVMLNSLTAAGAVVTLECLSLGAVDFVTKTTSANPVGGGGGGDLRQKVRAAALVRVERMVPHKPMLKPTPVASSKPAGPGERTSGSVKRLVVIGASTGGPKALSTVIPQLPIERATAYLVVQHMPVGFTAALAERLNGLSELTVREAKSGDAIESGAVLLAPGGSHMEVQGDGTVGLVFGEMIHGVRPAVDVTMKSAVAHYGSRVTGVVLTGMGSDALDGCREIKKAGGQVVVEHESTCVVYGMPKMIVDAGLADAVVPIDRIGAMVMRGAHSYARAA